jgi:hypothetical protein
MYTGKRTGLAALSIEYQFSRKGDVWQGKETIRVITAPDEGSEARAETTILLEHKEDYKTI